MSTNIIEININQTNNIVVAQEDSQNLNQPASDTLLLHKQTHDSWRWYGIKPEVRRLYELWAEIEAEDKAKPKKPRRSR